ncbi:hypothetical protein BDV98DRAFT_313912 [Pterulicium gracile]|uniref:F-box domain-containing protein n=1 Tax=Pterulicium gracile TaxID=1884261 RepID=A0A5C3QQT2_9AGAR|nr:hypothetical protein BDV98DRAFT_313912 [Pterula gracilis]
MHRALTVPELLMTIFEELDCDVSNRKQGHATLAACARTCKSVSNIALGVLWRQQNGFVPLLCCLPSEVLAITQTKHTGRVGGNRRTLRLQRPIRPEDWSRVFDNARFTQDMFLWEPENAFGNLDDQALESLFSSLSQQPSPLLRNLRKVRYRARAVRKAAYPFLAVASGSNVDSILYTNDGIPSTPELYLIQSLAQKSCTTITEFSCNGLIDKMTPHITCYESLVATLRSLPNLEFVSIPCYHPLLSQLSKLSSLRALSIESRAFYPFSELSHNVADSKRPQITGLNSLSLDFETASQLVQFLEHFDFTTSKLETLHIHLLHDCPASLQRRLFQAFQLSIYTEALTNLSTFIRYSTERASVPMGDILDRLVTSEKLETLEVLLPEFLTAEVHCFEAGDHLEVAVRAGGVLSSAGAFEDHA